jgi:2-oxoisovalerate dehydrogenase E1 component alpha subunit
MTDRAWWSEAKDKLLKDAERAAVLDALAKAERKPLPEWRASLFEDVYDRVPPNLAAQMAELEAHIRAHPEVLAGEDRH